MRLIISKKIIIGLCLTWLGQGAGALAAPNSDLQSEFLPYEQIQDALEKGEYLFVDKDPVFLELGAPFEPSETAEWIESSVGVAGIVLPVVGKFVRNTLVKAAISDMFSGLILPAEPAYSPDANWFTNYISHSFIVSNFGALALQASFELAVDLAAEQAGKKFDQVVKSYSTSPFVTEKEGIFYRVYLREPSKGDAALFSAINKYGRLSDELFQDIMNNSPSTIEVGEEVVQPEDWKVKLRDQAAYGSAALLENFCDAAFSQYNGRNKRIKAKAAFEKGQAEEKVAEAAKKSAEEAAKKAAEDVAAGPGRALLVLADGVRPKFTKPRQWEIWGTLANFVVSTTKKGLEGGKNFVVSSTKTAVREGLYHGPKWALKSVVASQYKLRFQRKNGVPELVSAKKPLGVANINGTFRYIYHAADTLAAEATSLAIVEPQR